MSNYTKILDRPKNSRGLGECKIKLNAKKSVLECVMIKWQSKETGNPEESREDDKPDRLVDS